MQVSEKEPRNETATGRARRVLVFVCDGTLSSTEVGRRSNAGRLAALLAEAGHPEQLVRYHPGIQGGGMVRWVNAALGRTIDCGIADGYEFLSRHWKPGDVIGLFGYSRGAYAVRSLAGLIGRLGLLRPEATTPERVETAMAHYRGRLGARRDAVDAAAVFSGAFCQSRVPIEVLGVWDTVRALGLPVPWLQHLMPDEMRFHDDALGPHIRHGYHALAHDEDRVLFEPVLWQRSAHWAGRLEQCWFPGGHGDVGGEIRGEPQARGLSNIALNWMLRRAESHGLHLPEDWESRFPEDPLAPSSSGRTLMSRLYWRGPARDVGLGDGEVLHLSLRTRAIGRSEESAQPTLDGLPAQ
ncbi:MAG: DUF2235 domain-containing protein [Pseudomonadota bacterium]